MSPKGCTNGSRLAGKVAQTSSTENRSIPKQDCARELSPSVKKLLVVIRKEPQKSDGSSLLLDQESGYRVISAEQGEPISLLARGKSIARWHPW